MRNFFWQRWCLIFLLVGRLVIGELGHAMPVAHSVDDMGAAHHHQMSAEMSSTAIDPAPCPEHDDGGQQSLAAHHAGDVAADTSSHCSTEQDSTEQDCCKSGECECPCLLVPCLALDGLVSSPIATTSLHTPQGAEELTSQRPSGLFRPPA